MLAMQMRITLTLKQLVGGATSSIFSRAEELLYSDGEMQEALFALTNWEEVDGYRSFIDFLFCELFPEWKEPCFWFYRDWGPQLRVYLTEGAIRQFDEALCLALTLALEWHRGGTRNTWRRFKRQLPALTA